MSRVIATVAKATPPSPTSVSRSEVASDVARMLTRLLPNRIAPISRSLSSVRVSANFAPREPSSAIRRKRARLAAVSAVSEPEKPALNMSSRATPKAVTQILPAAERGLADHVRAGRRVHRMLAF